MAVMKSIELKTKKGKCISVLLIILLSIGAVIQFLPLLWMILATFKTEAELTSAIPHVFPANWSFKAYFEAFSKYHIMDNFSNTLIICASVVLLQVTNSAVAGYALSKLKPRSGEFLYMMFLGTMMFSGTALMFPLYIMMTQLGLIGSKLALILSSSVWAYSIVLFKSFFDNIPQELVEAASIDGASSLRIFVTMIIPLSKPVLAVNILNTFMAVYNDFLYPLMLLPNEKDWTVMMRLYMMDKLGTIPHNVIYVLMVAAVVPILIIYLFVQKNITEGVSTTGLKG
ncbi:MAG: carbohydrate ABC transporter permease [Clostridia bacterium]|nr:carbohydrate ABC transporter permease [Clostridia bacterium]